jgi:transcription-repair coupling factor (superfamily II helicase)
MIPILYFPPYNILPFKFLAYHSETAAKRLGALYQLMTSDGPFILVTTIDAVMQKIIPKKEIGRFTELIIENEETDREWLIEKLISGGYGRTGIVEEPGDFSVRGGILDIFSPMYTDPLRLEFFGDTVESIRFFSAGNQRKIRSVKEAVLLPAKEVILNRDAIPQIVSRIRSRGSELETPVSQVRKIIDPIKMGQGFPGIESLIALIYPELDTLFDYLPDKTLMIGVEPESLEKTANETTELVAGNYTTSCESGKLCVLPGSLYIEWAKVKEIILNDNSITFKELDIIRPEKQFDDFPLKFSFALKTNSDLSAELKNTQVKENLLKPLADWIVDKNQAGCTAIVVCRSQTQANRLVALLSPYGIDPAFLDSFATMQTGRNPISICLGQVSTGFIWPAESLAIITEDEIFGTKHHRRKSPEKKPSTQFLDLQDLKTDDLVVHVDHGIGRYEGLVKLSVDGIKNDFLNLVYQAGDKLYLPVDRMNMVQKYMGVDGIDPELDKMGGKSWQRVKARVKRSAEKIAGELLKLYARRKVEKGFAFSPADSYFQDFETGFTYEETADQLKAIDDVLHDMQSPVPMDRLVCGDVGYGKTEVALRASFLAVNDGKQVAVLVPTTILAEQHYATFSGRFERYPINIACLSRFRSVRDQRTIISDVKSGKVDIVIGTHRLFQKDVAFKDLGLLVLDEEQRFGVKHKEKLKKLRTSVHVLALTATPIPRTLHLSLIGVRDISIIATPPEYRKSIITYISEFDETILVEAIRKELRRGGQIYFVHNHIETIGRMARRLQQLNPEIRLAVAHGRLAEDELEAVMLRFMNKEIDMLVCTTIIESGLDIPSANTIIINHADRFGLAQIYQLRGRVGRADEQAYAYLLIPHASLLTQDAQKRLKVLMEHSDLGSGFQIAMNDLKIRGGGTILGASQSGHIAAVGYDMFLKLMESTIAELKGEPVEEPLEPEINFNRSAFLSEAYIFDIDQRMIAYRRLAKMSELKELNDFKSELIDRYGPLPDEAANLLLKIMLKVWAKKACVARLDFSGQQMVLHFSNAHLHHTDAIVEMILAAPEKFEFSPNHILKAKLTATNPQRQLAQAKNLLKEIALRVNS